jgi:hypothetical protein
MNKLLELATMVEESFKHQDGPFSQLCLKHLLQFENTLPLDLFEDELSNWTLQGNLPEQLNVYNGFGQPPVTLFNNGEFVVDLYFWTDIDTSLHSHSFAGAFKVLYGRSIHEQYDVKKIKNYSSDIIKTEITVQSIELLKVGDCKEIVRGESFNHRLIHLDQPTVTLCIRTINDKTEGQWHHFTNGLSVEKKDLSQDVLKCLFYYNYLFIQNEEKAQSYLRCLITKWDLSTALNLYERLTIDTMGLGDSALENYFELFNELYGDSEWFECYINFFKNLEENYKELSGDSAKERFLEHAINFQYDKGTAMKLLVEIQGRPLTLEQKEMILVN